MKLALKREVVREFKSGKSLSDVRSAKRVPHEYGHGVVRRITHEEAEQVIRDYLNGKFSMSKPKPKKRGGE